MQSFDRLKKSGHFEPKIQEGFFLIIKSGNSFQCKQKHVTVSSFWQIRHFLILNRFGKNFSISSTFILSPF